MIKARVFEVAACGGLLLTDHAPELERYYEIGREIEVFEDRRDLVRCIGRLLEDEPRREEIARAGYERTVRDHTWVQRLAAISHEIGLLDDASYAQIGSVS